MEWQMVSVEQGGGMRRAPGSKQKVPLLRFCNVEAFQTFPSLVSSCCCISPVSLSFGMCSDRHQLLPPYCMLARALGMSHVRHGQGLGLNEAVANFSLKTKLLNISWASKAFTKPELLSFFFLFFCDYTGSLL